MCSLKQAAHHEHIWVEHKTAAMLTFSRRVITQITLKNTDTSVILNAKQVCVLWIIEHVCLSINITCGVCCMTSTITEMREIEKCQGPEIFKMPQNPPPLSNISVTALRWKWVSRALSPLYLLLLCRDSVLIHCHGPRAKPWWTQTHLTAFHS